jgi:hypothetical protein
MKRVRSIFIAFALLTLSCNFMSNGFATPTPTEAGPVSSGNCPAKQPTQRDIDLALKHSDDFFDASDWKKTYTVMEYRVSVVWKSEKLNAMISFDDVIFCDVTNATLDDYYTNESFDIVFQYYQGHAPQENCQSGNLRLYEFEVQSQGYDYIARFWSEILDKDHIRESLLVFPTSDPESLNSYGKKIMPELPACE